MWSIQKERDEWMIQLTRNAVNLNYYEVDLEVEVEVSAVVDDPLLVFSTPLERHAGQLFLPVSSHLSTQAW